MKKLLIIALLLLPLPVLSQYRYGELVIQKHAFDDYYQIIADTSDVAPPKKPVKVGARNLAQILTSFSQSGWELYSIELRQQGAGLVQHWALIRRKEEL